MIFTGEGLVSGGGDGALREHTVQGPDLHTLDDCWDARMGGRKLDFWWWSQSGKLIYLEFYNVNLFDQVECQRSKNLSKDDDCPKGIY